MIVFYNFFNVIKWYWCFNVLCVIFFLYVYDILESGGYIRGVVWKIKVLFDLFNDMWVDFVKIMKVLKYLVLYVFIYLFVLGVCFISMWVENGFIYLFIWVCVFFFFLLIINFCNVIFNLMWVVILKYCIFCLFKFIRK